MNKIKINNFNYSNALGDIVLENITIYFEDEDFERYLINKELEEVDYILPGDVIAEAERKLAFAFLKRNYNAIFNEKAKISSSELSAIQDFFNLNNVQMATLLGIDKASYSNILKRENMSRSIGLLVIERLGMELAQPGAMKRMVDCSAQVPSLDKKMLKEISNVIYNIPKAA